MRLQSARHIAILWTSTVSIFLLTAWASGVLLPATPATHHPPLSYYVGLLGLLAVGMSLALTWRWVGRAGPSSVIARAAIRAALALLGVLWMLAMVFPFL